MALIAHRAIVIAHCACSFCWRGRRTTTTHCRGLLPASMSQTPSVPREDDPLVVAAPSSLLKARKSLLCCGNPMILGHSFDVVVVVGDDQVTANPVVCSLGSGLVTAVDVVCGSLGCCQLETEHVYLEVSDKLGRPHKFPLVGKYLDSLQPTMGDEERSFAASSITARNDHEAKALRQLASVLQPGCNEGQIVWMKDDRIRGVAPMQVFRWTPLDRLFVADIDGTITRSNIGGIVDSILLEQYAYCHDGICEFLTALSELSCCYLTARPLSLANSTRRFLQSLRQGSESKLPIGPLIGYPGSLAQVLSLELISHSIHEFKTNALRTHLITPFARAGGPFPLVAGIGNTKLDAKAYHEAGIPLQHIFWVDKSSVIHCLDGREMSEDEDDKLIVLDYVTLRGTSFQGFLDPRLSKHLEHVVVRSYPPGQHPR